MNRFKNILLFADPSTDVAVSSKWALTLAKQNHARLMILDVVGPLPRDLQRAITIMPPKELQGIVIKDRLNQLEKLAKQARKKWTWPFHWRNRNAASSTSSMPGKCMSKKAT